MVLAFVCLNHHGRFKKYRVEKAQASVILTGLTGAIIGCALNHTTRLPKKDADLREVAFTFMIQLKDTAMAVSKWKDASSMNLERLSKKQMLGSLC